MPLHFPLNNCSWLVLPNIEVLFEIVPDVLIAGEIYNNPIRVNPSPKRCAETSQLDIVRQNYQFFSLNKSSEISDELFSIRVVEKRKPSSDSLFVNFRVDRIFFSFFPFFFQSHLNPLRNKNSRHASHIYGNLIQIKAASILSVDNRSVWFLPITGVVHKYEQSTCLSSPIFNFLLLD